MADKIAQFMKNAALNVADGKENELSFEKFSDSMSQQNDKLGIYAKQTFKYQYEQTKLDIFIHRYNELKFIGFDISSDAVLMNPMTNMIDKINHFVDTYYVRSRTSPSYLQSMFHTLKQFVVLSPQNKQQKLHISNLKSAFNSIFKASIHEQNASFSPAKNLCLLIVGIDTHILRMPDHKHGLKSDAINSNPK